MNDIPPARALPASQPGATMARPAPRMAAAPSGPPIEASLPRIDVGFNSIASFEFMQRVARGLSQSDQIPPAFRARTPDKRKKNEWVDNPAALSNCMVALTMAHNMKCDVITVMWNLYVVEGRPSWSGQFAIGLINSSGLYKHPLRFDMTIEPDPKEYDYVETYWEDNQRLTRKMKISAPAFRCVAWTTGHDGERIEGEAITTEMTIAEGWYQKPGSKWQSMMGQMARYRAGTFFARVNCPHVLYGLMTEDEARDIIDAEPDYAGSWAVRADEEGRAEEATVTPTTTAPAVVEEAAASDAAPQQLTHQPAADLLSGIARRAEEAAPAATVAPAQEATTPRVKRRFGGTE